MVFLVDVQQLGIKAEVLHYIDFLLVGDAVPVKIEITFDDQALLEERDGKVALDPAAVEPSDIIIAENEDAPFARVDHPVDPVVGIPDVWLHGKEESKYILSLPEDVEKKLFYTYYFLK